MTTHGEIMAAIEVIDGRLDTLAARLPEDQATALPAGDCRVRDALCRLAARADSAALISEYWLDAGAKGILADLDIDALNQGEIDDREGSAASALLAEIRAGPARTLQAVQDMDEATLARELPFGEQPITVGEMIRLAGPGHDGHHLDEIQTALGG